jgi:hypothetical protein
MRAFDAEAYLAALEPPAFRAGTRLYTGRVLSVFEQAAFDVRFAQMANGQLSPQETARVFREYIEALFPAPAAPADTRSWLARWLWRLTRVLGTPPPPEPLAPADVFFALPVIAQMQGLEDFAKSRRTMPQPPGSADAGVGAMTTLPARGKHPPSVS